MSLDPNLVDFVRRMPKVELHVHLEGSIRPGTLLELARRRRVDLPADDVDGLHRWFRFRDFEHFVQIYLTCSRCLRDPEDFQLILEEFLVQQSRQQVLYSEVHFTISTHLANGANGDEVADAMFETLTETENKYGIRARIIPDIVRNVGVERADQTVEWALDARDRGVVALGLSGLEWEDDSPFEEHFRVAAAEGLHRVAHAGEHAGPESIVSALATCQAQRLGHGIRAIDDPVLVERLVEEQIPLEVCPPSNFRLKAVESLPEHPFDQLYRAGLLVTVNSDDPALFDTTLTDEYLGLAETFGYSAKELAGFSWTALKSAFLTAPERIELEAMFTEKLEEVGGKPPEEGLAVDS